MSYPVATLTRHPSRGQHQRGVALIVALVVLVVIGLTSVAVMRGSLSSDLVANNARVQNFAMQSAQLALRYCESQLELDAGARDITIQVPDTWKTYGNWSTSAAEVPSDWLASTDSSIVAATPPQCMAESSAIASNVFVVTARGFSPDYTSDEEGHTLTGSVVWLQSQVSLG